MFISSAYAQAAAAPAAGFDIMSIAPLILIFIVFYFLLIRPQQKKMKDHKAMIEGVRRGDNVVTGGGILGKVAKVNDDGTAEIEVAEGVRIKVLKGSIGEVRNRAEPAKDGGGASVPANQDKPKSFLDKLLNK